IGGDDIGNVPSRTPQSGSNNPYPNDDGFKNSIKTLEGIRSGLGDIQQSFDDQATEAGLNIVQHDYEPEMIQHILGKKGGTGKDATPYMETTTAQGDIALAVGIKAQAKGNLSDAIGAMAVAEGKSALAVGTTAISKGDYANAVGTAAAAEQEGANAFGFGATALGKYSNAVGTSQTEGDYSSAMGYLNRAKGENAVAVGTKNVSGTDDTNNTVAMGVGNKATGNLSVAIGSNNITTGQFATAYGKNNQALAERSAAWGSENKVNQQANNSTAIGTNIEINAANVYAVGNDITADLKNSVVLGSGSDGTETAKYVPTSQATIPTNGVANNSITYGGFAGSDSQLGDGAVLSIGSKDYERQIKHVAAGQITADSTDAINGSQLYAVLGVNPVVYTDKNGNRLTKQGDKFYNGNTEVPADQVIASMNNGNSSTTTPMALQNVASHLDPVDSTFNAGNDHTQTAPNSQIVSGGKTYYLNTPVNVETFRNNSSPALNQAATVGDVLNAGWALQASDKAVDFVTHADTVNFKSSDNSITVTGEYGQDNISQIDLKANIEFQKGGKAAEDGETADAVKLGDKTYNLGGGGSGENNWNLTVNDDNTTTAGGTRNLKTSTTITPTIDTKTGDITFNANTVTLPVKNGKVTVPTGDNANKLATAGDIANAINNSGWYVNSGANGGTNT
ncbi:MAG: hypothetical protein J6W29_08900, partial [Neisseriaceae bacterium]|nr:hypothetical protein [Neisseriaceae bacterium]